MSIFVESLYRLYHDHVIKKEKLDALLEEGKISSDDYTYITE